MQRFVDFLLLRWNLPRWVIPVIWTLYLMQQVYTICWRTYATLQNLSFPPMAAPWQNISSVIQVIIITMPFYLASEILQIALVGIILFAVQHLLFEKPPNPSPC